jgi:hypothetical protein
MKKLNTRRKFKVPIIFEDDIEDIRKSEDKSLSVDILPQPKTKKQQNASVIINEEQIKNASKINRSGFAKYTNRDRDVRSMNDEDFLNYSSFLLHQTDVHSTEKAREAYDTTKNYKKIETFNQFMKAISTILFVLLIIALCILTLFAFIYLIAYFRTDKVKRVIDFMMLGTAVSLVIVFIIFVYLFMTMSGTMKKIITLL